MTKTITIGPGETEPLLFQFDKDILGPNTAIGCTTTTEFAIAFPELNLATKEEDGKWKTTIYTITAVRQSRSRYGFYKLTNFTDKPIVTTKGTPCMDVTRWQYIDTETFSLQHRSMATLLMNNPVNDTLHKAIAPTAETAHADTEDAPPNHVTERSPEADAAAFEGLDDTNLRQKINDADVPHYTF